MRRWLLLLLGLLLILILTYFCFTSKSIDIKDYLISKTQTIYKEKGLKNINIEVQGEDWRQTRTLTLTGIVLTDKEREEAEMIAKSIDGVKNVDNRLVINSVIVPTITIDNNQSVKKIVTPSLDEIVVIEDKDENITDTTKVESIENRILICQSKFKELLTKNKIHFEYNRANIKKKSYKLLNKLIDVAKECPDENIIIEGHTDSDGSQSYNKKLSYKRANKVKEYLVNQGMDAKKLEAVGHGELYPVADNSTKEGKEKNRRIEFNIKGEK